jgi:hypothetical protein
MSKFFFTFVLIVSNLTTAYSHLNSIRQIIIYQARTSRGPGNRYITH